MTFLVIVDSALQNIGLEIQRVRVFSTEGKVVQYKVLVADGMFMQPGLF